jgi:hypothetical protein
MNIEFTQQEIEDLKKLIVNFNLYYESEDDVWTFNDLEDQRQIACDIVQILNNKI